MKTVAPEHVLTSVQFRARFYEARLVNDAGTVLWTCPHRHREYDVAVTCSEAERKRRIRDGRAS